MEKVIKQELKPATFNKVAFKSALELHEILQACFAEGFESLTIPSNEEGTVGIVEFWIAEQGEF